MTGWTYDGALVRIPWHADLPRYLRPDGPLGHLVQALLDTIDPWHESQSPIETVEFDDTAFLAMAVPAPWGSEKVWGVHRGHKARHPGLSPFVTPHRPVRTNLLTVELSGPPEAPVLVRAYGGDYTPPLPWMASAPKADGGTRACLDFWWDNAYQGEHLAIEDSLTPQAPGWYLQATCPSPAR